MHPEMSSVKNLSFYDSDKVPSRIPPGVSTEFILELDPSKDAFYDSSMNIFRHPFRVLSRYLSRIAPELLYVISQGVLSESLFRKRFFDKFI